MVPHSLNVAYSDGDAQILWRDSERVFHRGWRMDEDGKRHGVLFVAPATERPSRSCLDRLTHEYDLRDELEAAWAVLPLELVREANRIKLVLDDASGEPLETLLGVPMNVGRFLRFGIAISSALGKLHQRGLVHKDIKPANILFNEATGQVRLTGFGIASRFARERQSPHPPETIAGTLAYMAPEQTGRMNRSIDSRSDLYALGVTFYQMLTGALPFTAAEPMEWVHCHLARRAVPPAERLKEIPGAVSAIAMKLLAKRAEDRYQTAAGLESDLRHCQNEWEEKGRIDDFSLGERDTPDRLLIPEKLYGRQREVDALLASFDRIANDGPTELVLVSGYSGIGKSSVVNELQPVLVPPRGLFAFGKFDQYKRDIPYATLIQALQSLIRPLLGKSEEDLAPWRDALRETLGPNAGLMRDLVPELKLLIGEPPPVPELPPQDTQRRFQRVLRQFIGVFARPEHPLALFLDDLQWLDAATLDLLEHLVTRSDLHNLLLIGAYRDNEVTAAHPLMRKLEEIRKAGAPVQQIVLAPLARDDLTELIVDCFRRGAGGAAALAELIHHKTAGNPFFAIQFISSLVDEDLLTFNYDERAWSWDINSIRAKGHTDNVVDLMVDKLARLPVETQQALRLLACIGNSAEFDLLGMVSRLSQEEMHERLWESVRAGLVFRTERSYRFLHDRVQEAVYSLIPVDLRPEMHLRIGWLLAADTSKRAEAIFEIVNQLDRGAALIASRDEREQLAELNLRAGQRARSSTAYASALKYSIAGVALLTNDCWERQHELIFALELLRAECEFLTGELNAANERLAALATRAANSVERATVACLRMDVHTMFGRNSDAVAVALEYFRQLGIEWSAHPTKEEALREYDLMWSQLGERSIEDLIKLPLVSDPSSLATFGVLVRLGAPARFTDINLYSLAACRGVNLSIEHGNCDASCVAYIRVGMLAGPSFGDYEAGYRLAQLGYELCEGYELTRFQATTYQIFGLVAPWTKHVKSGRDLLHRAVTSADQIGDLTIGAYSRSQLVTHMLAAGDPLIEVQRAVEGGHAFMQRTRMGWGIDVIASQLALVKMLRGLTRAFGSMDCDEFDEDQVAQRLSSNPNLALATCWYCIQKLQASFFAGDYAAAVDALSRAQPLVWTATSYWEGAEYQFYAALSRAAFCDTAPAEERQPHLDALTAHHRQLRAWETNCPENFETRAALVGAEIARIEDRTLDAEQLYEQAIRSARINGFVHNEAIAYELAGRFYLARGFEEVAHLYLRNARQGYLRWGADGKVWQLDQLYPHLRQDGRAPGPAGTIEAPVEHLDLATMIEASQALSGEMVLEKLIDRLLRAAIGHAGAERGLLIVPQGDVLQIEAEAIAGGDDVIVRLRDGSFSTAALPESLVRYGTRTHETVILDDASSQNEFSADHYILQSRVRSILCLPLINQGKLTAILYLENSLTPNVFTPNRVALLKVLASQAAISLENARLYHDLANREQKIRSLVDSNIIGIIIVDRERRILEANDAFLRMLGYDRVDLALGRASLTELTPPEWREVDKRRWAELISTGLAQPFEKEYFRKDGSRVPVLVGAATMLKEGGNEGVAFVLDLTERKRAEEALRRSEAYLAEAQRLSRTSSWALDVRRREFVYLSSEAYRLFGFDPEKGIRSPQPFYDCILPGDREQVIEMAQQAVQEKAGREVDFRIALPDGSIKYVHSVGHPLLGMDGEVVEVVSTHIDVTEQHLANERLQKAFNDIKKSEDRLRLVVDTIPALVWRASPDGIPDFLNQPALDYTGLKLDQAETGWPRAFHPEDKKGMLQKWTAIRESGMPGELEARLRRFDGEYRRFLFRGVPLRDELGNIVKWYGSSTDIEDRTQALARLQQMQSDLAHMNRVSVMGELAASLSHEIAQPIASARNNARAAQNFMKMQPPDLGEVREALSCVVADADRSAEIIDRIREQIKKAPPRKGRFDLNAAIREVITLGQSVTVRNGVSVQVRLAEGLAPVLGDRIQLQQVMLNLILNAAEAMSSVEEGARELLISTEHDQTGAIVGVRDSGPGIDPAHFDRVFDAFYTTKSGGTGMGLSICRSIIHAHGGKLWVKANEPRGAAFQFTLPDAETELTAPLQASPRV
ncbi:ATP-binding sensor histidine kinase [Bradyrhizobium brasilense]|uniref:histidine kinase n=1 Tax=Bradyrhizobium brasilense TaxID=1419277 RepID=A0ABY8JNP1_9BRAD|nr:AAA family ATPase [Bradyrhizobium brasilense]WFU66116.1 AAA family ATPase [Bradyrhizobium brasilense]